MLTLIVLGHLAFAQTTGVSLSGIGVQGSARHLLAPGVGLWGTYSPRPWSITAEARVASAPQESPYYAYHQSIYALSVVGGWAGGTHATTVHAQLGPALRITRGGAEIGEEHEVWTIARPAARARLALEGPMYQKLVWSWQMGYTAHAAGADWDAGAGLGVAW